MDFEINIDFLSNYDSKKKLTKDVFKGSENLFNIFNTDGDNILSKNEIGNIFQKIINSSETNTQDTRKNQYALLDSKEAEHFINNNQNTQGKSYKELGVSISQLFDFLNVLKENMAQVQTQESTNDDNFTKIQQESSSENVEVDNETIEKIKEFRHIPERKDQQFTEQEQIQLAQLNDSELEKAKKLFFVEGRTKQFSASEIINLITNCGGKYDVNKENNDRFNEFLSLKRYSTQELNAEEIVLLMTLPKDKIDDAIKLLNLENRIQQPLSMSEVVSIITCNSEELIKDISENPNLQFEEKIHTTSQYWICLNDSDNNTTYRYIKGQKYPEEISEQQLQDGTIQRTVYNKNLNIKQSILFDELDNTKPIRIETQHLKDNGSVEYTEIMEKGINPGTPDIYTIDANGNKKYLQQTIVNQDNASKTVSKHFENAQGTITDFSYTTLDNNEYTFQYKITDKDGNQVFSRQIELTQIGENLYEYKKDNKTYQIKINSEQCEVTDKSDNTSYVFNYSDYIKDEDNPEIFKQNILNIPADILIYLTQKPLSLSYGRIARDNQGYNRAEEKAIDIGKITKTNSETELNEAFITILIHELGHYIDNPDLNDNNSDILSLNEDLSKIYKEELEEFNKNSSTEEQRIMLQFNEIGFKQKSKSTRNKRTLSEVFAESNMVSLTNSKSWTAARSYYLQRYFPRTIAKAQELLSSRIHN